MAMEQPALRLGVFVDAPFYQDPTTAKGAVHVHPDAYSFLLFVYAVAEHFSRLTVFGRRAGSPDGLVPLPINDRVWLCGLPGYDSLRDVRRVLRVTVPTARTVWRGLRDVDILWAMGPHPFGVIGGLLAFARRRAVVLGVRQETIEYFRTRIKSGHAPMLTLLSVLEAAYRLLGRMWRVTAVGSAVARRYGAPRPGVLDMVIALVKRSQRRELAVDDRSLDRVRLLTVGRIAVDKNPLLLVEAMSRLESRNPDRFSLTWVGTGPAGTTARRGDASKQPTLVTSSISQDLFPSVLPFDRYATADIFVHVALTEGVPQVLLEAAALGVPIVATKVGGVGDAMDQGTLRGTRTARRLRGTGRRDRANQQPARAAAGDRGERYRTVRRTDPGIRKQPSRRIPGHR